MKIFRITLIGIFLYIIVQTLGCVIFAQENQMTQEEWVRLANPGPNHEYLKQFAGSWNEEWTYYEPGKEPMKGIGKSDNTMILGNRFLSISSSMEMMGTQMGMLHIIGFDNRNEKFFFFGIDEFGTYSVFAEGDYDKDKSKIILLGDDKDPVTGKIQPYRMVMTLINNDKYQFEVFTGAGEKEYLSVDVVLTRK